MSFKEAIAKIKDKAKTIGEAYMETQSDTFGWVKLNDVLAVVAGLQRQLRQIEGKTLNEWFMLFIKGELPEKDVMELNLVKWIKVSDLKKRVFGEQKE